MKTLDLLYIPILTSIGLTLTEKFHILSNGKPWTIGGMPVILPTRENTREVPEDTVYAHWLSEDFFIGGQSDTIKRLKKSVLVALDRRIMELATELSAIACNIKKHGDLNPKQSALINKMPKIQDKHQAPFNRWIKSLTPSATGGIVMSLVLKENLSIEGHRYKRGAKIYFDLLESLTSLVNSGGQLNKFTKAETETIAGVFDYILNPWTKTDYGQEFGSDNATAPYLASLLEAYSVVMERLNYVHKLFYPLMSDTYRARYTDPELMAKLDWAPPTEWVKFYREIPPFPHNRGNEEQETQPAIPVYQDADRDTITTKPKAAVAQQTTTVQQQHQPVAEETKSTAALTENRGGIRIIQPSELPSGITGPQYDAWGRQIQPGFQQQQQQPVAANAANGRYLDAQGNVVDINGNILALNPNNVGNAPVQNNGWGQPVNNGFNNNGFNQQPNNQFSNGPFGPNGTNQQPNNQFNNGGFGNGGFNNGTVFNTLR